MLLNCYLLTLVENLLAGGFENGEESKNIGLACVQEVVDFYSTHEEADTRMILHALHANNVFEK